MNEVVMSNRSSRLILTGILVFAVAVRLALYARLSLGDDIVYLNQTMRS
jgi:hypothetical protein